LNKKLDKALEYVKNRLLTNKAAYAKPKAIDEEQLDELSCWSGYHRVAGTKAGFPGSCAKNKTNEEAVDEADMNRRGFLKGLAGATTLGLSGKASAQLTPDERAKYLKYLQQDVDRYQREYISKKEREEEQKKRDNALRAKGIDPYSINDRVAEPSSGYVERIKARIQPNITFSGAGSGPVGVEIRVAPDGTILSRKIIKSSGDAKWDDAIIRGIDKTMTLPRDIDSRVPPTVSLTLGESVHQGLSEEQHSCPHCGGEMVSEELMNEKKDACYYKVKSRYKVWPSAYASGALVKCRKKGADSWGNGGKKNESSILEGIERADESLHDWFNKEKWVRMDTKGKIKGPCAREPGEGKPKCLPQAKAHSLGKKGRASAAQRKRREDPNPERSGKAINVDTKKSKG
jgi:colicin import membrane protein